MSLPPEVRNKYVDIIDDILKVSDLTTVSEKRIRKGIQAAVEYDITPQKTAIKALIMERFDEFNARESDVTQDATTAPSGQVGPSSPPITNGHTRASTPSSKSPVKRRSESEELSDVADEALPKKKRKPDTVDADAQMAARLQAEENLRARPTRGGGTRKSVVKKKTPKKKTSTKVRAEDDSEIDGSSSGEKPIRNTGFHKPMLLSPALSALLDGETTLSRPQTVKRLWQHIKGNDLQDPSDKRNIICDEPMRAVFKQDKVHMFTMTKILNQNLYNPDE